MEQKDVKIEDLIRELKQYLPLAIIYTILITMMPLLSIFHSNELFPIVSLVYQIIGIFLLYVDEKFKMDRDSNVFPKMNSSLIRILKAPFRSISILNQILNFSKKSGSGYCNLSVDIKITPINHEYDDLKNIAEKEKARYNSIASDLKMLRYFSETRRTGYILLAIGFVFQFITLFSK